MRRVSPLVCWTRSWGYCASCGLLQQGALVGAYLGWGAVAVARDESLLVVELLEVQKGQAQLFDRVEGADPQQVLLERADEALGAAVALRLAHEGGRALDAQEGELPPKVVGQVGRAVVVTDLEPTSCAFPEGAEALARPLMDRLQRLETVAAVGCVDPHALGSAMIDCIAPGLLDTRLSSARGYGWTLDRGRFPVEGVSR